uniref:Uncharacterized protein n=1 Tax=Anguilla anguilla TaxID=7936 RepID=A0A0E9SV61_ANGAN
MTVSHGQAFQMHLSHVHTVRCQHCQSSMVKISVRGQRLNHSGEQNSQTGSQLTMTFASAPGSGVKADCTPK